MECFFLLVFAGHVSKINIRFVFCILQDSNGSKKCPFTDKLQYWYRYVAVSVYVSVPELCMVFPPLTGPVNQKKQSVRLIIQHSNRQYGIKDSNVIPTNEEKYSVSSPLARPSTSTVLSVNNNEALTMIEF